MEKYVLIVDDNPDIHQIHGMLVESLDISCKTAFTGQEALNQVTEAHPSLILLDLMMPGMDGFAVINYLQARPTTRKIPVIVVTSLESDQVDQLRLPGIIDVVGKGNNHQLIDSIQMVLQTHTL